MVNEIKTVEQIHERIGVLTSLSYKNYQGLRNESEMEARKDSAIRTLMWVLGNEEVSQ